MEYRLLGRSGFKVPVLTFGTGTFGGKGEFFKAWGDTDAKDADAAGRYLPRCTALTMFDSADIYSAGAAEEVLGAAIKGRRDKVLISTKSTFRTGEGANDVGSSRFHHHSRHRSRAEAAGHRSHRSGAAARLRRQDAAGGSAVHPRRSDPRRQDPLYRRFQFLRLASDEGAGGVGPLRLSALCREPDLLLADRPRL